jgi:hypothetical protein
MLVTEDQNCQFRMGRVDAGAEAVPNRSACGSSRWSSSATISSASGSNLRGRSVPGVPVAVRFDGDDLPIGSKAAAVLATGVRCHAGPAV